MTQSRASSKLVWISFRYVMNVYLMNDETRWYQRYLPQLKKVELKQLLRRWTVWRVLLWRSLTWMIMLQSSPRWKKWEMSSLTLKPCGLDAINPLHPNNLTLEMNLYKKRLKQTKPYDGIRLRGVPESTAKTPHARLAYDIEHLQKILEFLDVKTTISNIRGVGNFDESLKNPRPRILTVPNTLEKRLNLLSAVRMKSYATNKI